VHCPNKIVIAFQTLNSKPGTVAEKDMVYIWSLIRLPTASLGVLEPL